MSDPGAACVRAELARATAPHALGFIIAVLGLIAAVLRGTALPGLPKLLPVALIVTALGLMAIGMLRRWRYHRRRSRGHP